MDRPEVTVATVCGGSLALAMAGLIDGRPASGRCERLIAHERRGTVWRSSGVEPVPAAV